MKHLLLLFCTIVILSLGSAGQDYQLFPPGRTMFFNDLEYGFQPDSIWYEGDQQIVQNYKSPVLCHPYSEEITYSGWLSNAYVYDSLAKEYQFLNRDSLSITFDHGTKPGDTWEFYLGSTFYIQANHVQTDTMTFLGKLDSVKMIQLQAFDFSNMPVVNHWNGTELLISQHHGAIKWFNVDVFPTDFTELNLTGITQPDVGETGLKEADFKGFEVGDELHFISSNSYITIGAGDYSFIERHSWKFLKKLGENRYEVERRVISTQNVYSYGVNDTNFVENIVSMSFPDFGKYPELSPILDTSIPFTDTPIGFVSYAYDSAINKRYKQFNLGDSTHNCEPYSPCIYSYLYNPSRDCWEYNIDKQRYYMFEGIGMLFYRVEEKRHESSYYKTRRLVYFKNSEGSWGEPLNVSRFFAGDGFLIYPNQIRERFRIAFPNEYKDETLSIRIEDLSGKILFSSLYVEGDKFISLPPDLPKGYHVAKIFQQNRRVHIEKIIKY